MNRAHRRATGATNTKKRKPTLSAIESLRIAFCSNSPAVATGYGTQTAQVTTRMQRSGHDVAVLCNYGLEGCMSEWNGVTLYPRGFANYSEDVIQAYSMHWAAQAPHKPSVVFTLYDTWVYLNNTSLPKIPRIYSWVPIDHQPTPPQVAEWCARPNVTPIAMSRFGQDMLEHAGIESVYIPHAIEKVFKPTQTMDTPAGRLSAREILGIDDDAFVVMMNSANKGVLPCRKAFGQNLLAFSIFALEHPDAVLYLHTEDSGSMGGINLPELVRACGIKPEQVRFVDQFAYRNNIPQDALAAFYTMADVCLQTSMGEGFGIPTIEAQACGTRVIVSDFAASSELVGPGWLVGGQPEWDPMQKSWFFTPMVGSIVDALNGAYLAPRGACQDAIAFAAEYDADKVYTEHWAPLLKQIAEDAKAVPDLVAA